MVARPCTVRTPGALPGRKTRCGSGRLRSPWCAAARIPRSARHAACCLRNPVLFIARAVGEIGSIILITGNLPFKTEVASVFIFQRLDGDPHGAAAVSVVLLGISFAVLLLVGGLPRYTTRHDRG